MKEKIIVIKPDDTIDSADYGDFASLQEAVNGLFEHFFSFTLPIDSALAGKETEGLDVDLYCNEEFLLSDSEEFDKINAVASFISNQEIRGNVAMVVGDPDSGENRGFEYRGAENDSAHIEPCEYRAVCDFMTKFVHLNERHLEYLHKEYDNNKSEPRIEVYGLDEEQDNRKNPVERE